MQQHQQTPGSQYNKNYENPIVNQKKKRQGDLKPEVFFVGQIVGGIDFETSDGLFCEMMPDAGEHWELLQPQQKTFISQTCYTEYGQMFVWGHPIDLHFSVNSLSGWPKAVFKIWRLDETNKIDIFAYGVVPFPKTSGYHRIVCNTWSPIGDWTFGTLSFFLGNQPQIQNQGSQKNSVPYSIVNNDPKRKELLGISNGKIIIEMECMLKNFTISGTSGEQKEDKKGQDSNSNDKSRNFWDKEQA